MKVEILDKHTLKYIAETRQEIVEALKAFKRGEIEPNSDAWIETILKPEVEFIVKDGRTVAEANGGWARVTIETEYLEPYIDLLARYTGFDPREGGEFNVDLTPAVSGTQSTYITEKFEYKDKQALYTYVGAIYTWMDHWLFDDIYDDNPPRPAGKKLDQMTLRQKAEHQAAHSIAIKIGKSDVEHEFIQTGNGMYKPNPNYGRGQTRYYPATESQKLWDLIWMHWHDTLATPEQHAILARLYQTHQMKYPLVPQLCHNSDGMHLDKCTAHITWKEFAALGKQKAEG